jgi:Outer membrane protein beta-barrel domain
LRRTTEFWLVMAILGLLVATPAAAQMGFGIKGGLNVADLSDLKTVDTWEEFENESKTGFVGGGYVKFPLGPMRLQVEGLYSLKGAKGTTGGGSFSSEPWETKLTYLEIPVLLKYEFPTPALKPFIYGGASVAFLMKAEMRNERINSDWVDLEEEVSSTDYGLVAGVGIELLGITIEGRYTHGLADVASGKDRNTVLEEAKNKTWSAMAGIDFF